MEKLITVGITAVCLATTFPGCTSTSPQTTTTTTDPQAPEHTLADDIGDLTTQAAIEQYKKEHPGEAVPGQ